MSDNQSCSKCDDSGYFGGVNQQNIITLEIDYGRITLNGCDVDGKRITKMHVPEEILIAGIHSGALQHFRQMYVADFDEIK